MTSSGVCFDWELCRYYRMSCYIFELNCIMNSKWQFLSCASIVFSERYFDCWAGRIGEEVTNINQTSQLCYTSLLIKRHSDTKFFNRGLKRLCDSNNELSSKQDIETMSGQKIFGRKSDQIMSAFSTTRQWDAGIEVRC